MLRSFRYASAPIGAHDRGLRPEDVVNLQPWARFWYLWVSVAFLDAYLTAAANSQFLPPTRGAGDPPGVPFRREDGERAALRASEPSG